MKDGGPAFPRPDFSATESNSQEGMSLRDWFAGQALGGQIAMEGMEGNDSSHTAAMCYELADAMIAERAKEKGTP